VVVLGSTERRVVRNCFPPLLLLGLTACDRPPASSSPEPAILTAVTLTHTSAEAVCNDGSVPSYYVSLGTDPRGDKWMVWLEGGGSCGSTAECAQRWVETPYLTTGAVPATVDHPGFFARQQATNPDFYDWTKVFIHYCSSDGWTGNRAASADTADMAFHGPAIIQAVLDDLTDSELVGERSLEHAEEVIFGGSSAGAWGLVSNLDAMAARVPNAHVVGVSDSSLIPVDVFPVAPAELVAPLEGLASFWGTPLNATCTAAEPLPSLCLLDGVLGESYTQTPLFVFGDQLDLLHAAGIADPQPADFAVFEAAYGRWEGVYSPIEGTHMWAIHSVISEYEIDGETGLDVFGRWFFDRGGETAVIQHL